MTKKLVSGKFVFTLALVMIFAMLSASCAQSTNTQATTTQTTAAQSVTSEPTEAKEGYTLPLTTSGETLTIASHDYMVGVSVADNPPVFKAIEDKTGVKIIWQVDPTNYDTTMSTRIAAGTDLPDMFLVPTGVDAYKLATDGIIIPLNDLIEKSTMDMKKWFENTPDIKQAYTMPDGKIHSLPMTFNEDSLYVAKFNNLVLMLRQDWLDTLKLGVPKTVDEFYNVLKAFKTGDPNGNKKQDEVPYCGSWSGIGINTIAPLGWMFGLHLTANDGAYPDANGKLEDEWISPRMKDFLVTLNKWFKEGLIDLDFMNLTFDKWNAQINNNTAGATCWFNMGPGASMNGVIQGSSGNPDASFVQIPSPSGPYGDGIIEALVQPHSGDFVISKDCKNPELAIRWLDYASYSDDAIMYQFYGIEGVSYELKDGKPVILDSMKNDKDGQDMAMQRVGTGHQDIIPIIATKDSLERVWGEMYANTVKNGEETYAQMMKAPKVINTFATPEETEQLTVVTDMMTYRNEMMLKFITGDAPLSEFDTYVNQMKKMGSEKVLGIKQAQYDRIYK